MTECEFCGVGPDDECSMDCLSRYEIDEPMDSPPEIPEVPSGACVICGGPDADHRTVDAQMERVIAGEPIFRVAEDYDRTISLMVASWAEAYDRAFTAWHAYDARKT